MSTFALAFGNEADWWRPGKLNKVKDFGGDELFRNFAELFEERLPREGARKSENDEHIERITIDKKEQYKSH